MTSPAGTVNYTYWIDGALKTREVLNTSGNPVTYSNNEYNPAGMLKKLKNKTSANGSQRSLYDMSGSGAFDGVLNLKSMAATVSGLTSFTGTLNWNNDSSERLASETSSARSGVMGSASYDGADNILTRGSSGWSYNSNNQITPASGQWSYDGNGNATLQRGRSCGFDPFNRLGTITQTNEWSVGYTYRADGLMASRAKTVYVYMFGQWMAAEAMPTYYFHDGGEPILEMESDMGIEGSTLTVSAINVRGPDGLVARKQGGSWIYYDFDQQGSMSQRLNASGTVLSSSVYDAYGAETNNGSPTDPFGYCAQWGYWFDRDTGMYLCQARWYDPVTARWVNRDPIGYAGGANLYGYCGGGPVGAVDPSGFGSLYRWFYTGDWNASDDVYEAALEGGAGGINTYVEAVKSGASFGLYNSPCNGDLGFEEAKWTVRTGVIPGLLAGGLALAGKVGASAAAVGGGLQTTSEITSANSSGGARPNPSPEGCPSHILLGPTRPQIRAMGQKLIREDPDAVAKYGQSAVDMATKRRNPLAIFGNGQGYPMHWSHEPIPYAEGGTTVVLRAPWNHPGFHFRP